MCWSRLDIDFFKIENELILFSALHEKYYATILTHTRISRTIRYFKRKVMFYNPLDKNIPML